MRAVYCLDSAVVEWELVSEIGKMSECRRASKHNWRIAPKPILKPQSRLQW